MALPLPLPLPLPLLRKATTSRWPVQARRRLQESRRASGRRLLRQPRFRKSTAISCKMAVLHALDEAALVSSIDPASRKARDAGLAKSMDDLAIQRTSKTMPFDSTRMSQAGFATNAQT
jgi:hypothetical protein